MAPISESHSSYLSSTFTLVSSVAFARATMTAKTADSCSRVRRAILWLMFLLCLLALSPFLDMSPSTFFAFVLLNAALQGTAGAYFQTAVVALASLFGPFAIQAIFAGQAAVGVLVSLLQFITAAASMVGKAPIPAVGDKLPGNRGLASTSAFLFFTVSTLFLGVTLVVHRWLSQLPALKEMQKVLEVSRTSGLYLEADEEEDREREEVVGEDSLDETYFPGVQVETKKQAGLWDIAKSNGLYNIAVAYVFIVSLSVFPPITASIQSTQGTGRTARGIFSPILFTALHFLLFNVGDYCGRTLCSFPRFVIWDRRKLLSLSVARTIFIPLFLACNIQTNGSPPTDAPLINSDVIYLSILLMFGMSNGYVATTCMMAASSIVNNDRLRREEADTAATVAQLFLISGLALGSLTSFGVRALVCNCNPFEA